MVPLLTKGSLKTLSYIFHHQPVEQNKVAQARGTQAYKHLKILEQTKLIERKKERRKTKVTLNPDLNNFLKY
jgi:chromosome segregation and condensation protein ScpB